MRTRMTKATERQLRMKLASIARGDRTFSAAIVPVPMTGCERKCIGGPQNETLPTFSRTAVQSITPLTLRDTEMGSIINNKLNVAR